jgi:hypothetical protein
LREKLEDEIREVARDIVSHGPTRDFSTNELLVDRTARATARDILTRLATLRARAERQAVRHANGRRDVLPLPAVVD